MSVVGVATAAAEVGAFYLAAYLKGENHNFLPFALFFPIPFLFSIPFLHLLLFAVVTMLLQFPVYGYLVGQAWRSEEHTSELQSRLHLVCRLLLEKKKKIR